MALAKSQGVSVDEAVLTKLLLFERNGSTEAFDLLVRSVTESENGRPSVIGEMEATVRKSEKAELPKPWDGPFMREWMTLDPVLAYTDIRGALYVSREHAPLVLAEKRLSQAAADILNGLLEHPDMAASAKADLLQLDPKSLSAILDKLLEAARKEQEWGAPKILTACLAVTHADPHLGGRLAAFLMERPSTQIKASIVPKIAGEPWADEVLDLWSTTEEVITPVKTAIKNRKEKK